MDYLATAFVTFSGTLIAAATLLSGHPVIAAACVAGVAWFVHHQAHG